MKAFDLHRMALDKAPPAFLWEVALRCLYTFVLVFLFLKITGRRGVRQMSLFEVLIILTLGSAAGDVAFYDNVPMLPVLVVFITLALLYRLVILPAECVETFTLAPRACDAAYVKCSAVVHFLAGERKSCPRCANGVWSHASREKRIA
ncbi:hypothetical protein QDZ26_000232 [Pluralibacter gergoviae]|nr:DUF421 domain-containing protein [Pluralibacter gergoviae]